MLRTPEEFIRLIIYKNSEEPAPIYLGDEIIIVK